MKRNLEIVTDSAKMMDRHAGFSSVAITSLKEFINTDNDIMKKKDYSNIIAAELSILLSRIRLELEIFSDAFTKYVEATSRQIWLEDKIGTLDNFNKYNKEWIIKIHRILKLLIAASTGFKKNIINIEPLTKDFEETQNYTIDVSDTLICKLKLAIEMVDTLNR